MDASSDTHKEEEFNIETIKKMYNVRGTAGLQNIGNTCFMNAGLQCISAAGHLRAYLFAKGFIEIQQYNIIETLAKEERKKRKLPPETVIEIDKQMIIRSAKNSVTYGLYHLIKDLWSERGITVVPDTFKAIIGAKNSTFGGFRQQDSQELINFVLDSIHEELKMEVKVKHKDIPNEVIIFRDNLRAIQAQLKAGTVSLQEYVQILDNNMDKYVISASLDYWELYIKKSNSVIRDIFTGMTYTTTKCNKCGISSLAFEPFLMLNMPIPESQNSVSLEECFANYSKTQLLTGANKYSCNTCKEYNDATQNISIWETPNILIIHLKRFTNDMMGNICRTGKNSTKIVYPLIDLSVRTIVSPYNTGICDAKYDLFGIVQQYGSLNGGHYVACCKNSINKKWYSYDDSTVIGIPEEHVQNHIICQNAYILFYEKQQ